jgi:hypothetical protein
VTLTADMRQMEAEELAQARETVQKVLQDWHWMTWDQLLADDVVLLLRLEALTATRVGSLGGVEGNLQVRGREKAKPVLKRESTAT